MALYNHNLAFRPLRGGTAILNPLVNEPGTLGCLLTTDGADRWILSCYHVLGRSAGQAFSAGESIFQPYIGAGVIARNSPTKSNWELDCSAAQIAQGIAALPDVLGIASFGGAGEPAVGMRVIKSGAETGVTEGVVSAVNGDAVEVGVHSAFDPNYELSGPGDSGSVWFARDSLKAVALHRAGSSFGPHTAYATKMSSVLAFLSMNIVTS